MKIPQKFLGSLFGFKKNYPDLWEEKYRLATKRLLSSTFFLISAKRCYKNENKLLSAIGYYYSIFHLSKALLFLHPQHSIDDIQGISHKKVFNLIQAQFVQRKILSNKFGSSFDYFKQIREAANYKMGLWISLSKTLGDEEHELLVCIAEGISVFKAICKNEMGHIRSLIGDGIGDDWMDSYLSEDEAQEVVNFFLKHDLTT